MIKKSSKPLQKTPSKPPKKSPPKVAVKAPPKVAAIKAVPKVVAAIKAVPKVAVAVKVVPKVVAAIKAVPKVAAAIKAPPKAPPKVVPKVAAIKTPPKTPPKAPPAPLPASWDEEYDFLVMGSGAGGLTAALVASLMKKSVLVLEKSSRFGGTTAISGGGLWVPCHGLNTITQDDKQSALTYLKKTIGSEEYQEERVEAYVQNAGRIIRALGKQSLVRFKECVGYSDYYPDKEGALPGGGRTIQPIPFSRARLGEKGRKALIKPLGWSLLSSRISMTMEDAHCFISRKSGWMLRAMTLVLRYWLDVGMRLRSQQDRRATLGSALMARLYASLIKRKGVVMLHDAPVTKIFTKNAKVVGVAYTHGGKTIRVKGRSGVVLAAGGFEHNSVMRQKYLPKPTNVDWSAGHPDNTGDGIHLATEVGASISMMDKAWWSPVYVLEGKSPVPMFADRASPGCLIVDRKGKRFVNEAASYLDVGKAMYHASATEAFVIVDEHRRERFACGPIMPKSAQRTLPKRVRGLVKIANTIEELAQKLGIDPQVLKETVKRFNHHATVGKDDEFSVGENSYDRYYGSDEERRKGLHPCLGKIGKAPFYGFPIQPGDIGTKGGISTDAHGRALRSDGTAIEGLYATGNCAASMMGDTYPGAGSTIGPAMIFAALAVEHSLGYQLS